MQRYAIISLNLLLTTTSILKLFLLAAAAVLASTQAAYYSNDYSTEFTGDGLYSTETSEDVTSFDFSEMQLDETPAEYEARQTGASCRDRGNYNWCTNGFGGVSCRWNRGQCENDRGRRSNNGRASCRDRGTRNWCTNNFQPRSGRCEWNRGQCRVASRRRSRTGARCLDRGNRQWCENGMGGVTCKWRRGECKNRRREDEEDEVSADYDFESNSADYFEEE